MLRSRGAIARSPILALTLGLFALPPATDLAFSGARRPFGYLAADAFYYLTVARNMSEHARVSYDGVHGTNGFHPLWQYALGAYYAVLEHAGASEPALMALVLVLEIVLVLAALYFVALFFMLRDGRLSCAFLLFPVGAYAGILAPLWYTEGPRIAREAIQEGALPLYGTLWSYVNGMESAVVLLAFAVLAWRYASRPAFTARDGLVLGALAAALTLARLDHVLFALAILGGAMLDCLFDRHRRPVLTMIAGFAIPIGAYLLWNRIHYGTAMPVSGSLKTTFPALEPHNWQRLKVTLTSPVASPIGRTYREAQIVIPFVFALAYAPRAFFWRRLDRRQRLLTATGAGVIALALYNQLFVTLYFQGQWYFPVSTLYCSLAVYDLVERRLRVPGAVAVVGAAAVAVATLVVFVTLGRRADYHTRYADFYFDQAAPLRAFYDKTSPGRPPCFLEVDDGIFAYATRYPSLSGFGLNMDLEGVRALKSERLLPYAVAQGCGRVTSVVYIMVGNAHPGSSSKASSDIISGVLRRDDTKRFDFAVEYTDRDIAVVRVTPKSAR